MTHKLREKALKGCDRGETRYFIVAAGYSRKNNLLAIKNNIPSPKPGNRLTHAEGVLMKMYGRRLKRIVIYRVGHGGDPLPIQPCEVCLKLAKRLGIKIETTKEI